MNTDLGMSWKSSCALTENTTIPFAGGTHKSHDKPQSGQLVAE